jgi:hypothetical protein
MNRPPIILSSGVALFTVLVLSVNLLSALLVFPYLQKAANSHMNDGQFFSFFYYGLTGLSMFFAVKMHLLKKHRTLVIGFIFFALTFVYWGYRLYSLQCLGCLNSG